MKKKMERYTLLILECTDVPSRTVFIEIINIKYLECNGLNNNVKKKYIFGLFSWFSEQTMIIETMCGGRNFHYHKAYTGGCW